MIMTKDEQIDKLKRLCRYQFFTLGFYGTPYNYDDQYIAYHPIDGSPQSGIKHDGGGQAREAKRVMIELGFSPEEVSSWKGPFVKE